MRNISFSKIKNFEYEILCNGQFIGYLKGIFSSNNFLNKYEIKFKDFLGLPIEVKKDKINYFIEEYIKNDKQYFFENIAKKYLKRFLDYDNSYNEYMENKFFENERDDYFKRIGEDMHEFKDGELFFYYENNIDYAEPIFTSL